MEPARDSGTPVPLPRRPHPNAKPELRARARTLRAAGRTYPEIAAELGVSKSSVSLWTRDLPKPPRSVDRGRAAARARWDPVLRARAAERCAAKLAAAREIGALDDRELLLVGAALYWAEGGKDKPHARRERLAFINSDPDVIRLYLRWLALFGVGPERCLFAVSIHESADVPAAEAFWAAQAGVRVEDLGKTSLKRHNPRTVRKNVGEGYRGCLSVTVRQSAELYRRVEGWWYGIVVGAMSGESGAR